MNVYLEQKHQGGMKGSLGVLYIVKYGRFTSPKSIDGFLKKTGTKIDEWEIVPVKEE